MLRPELIPISGNIRFLRQGQNDYEEERQNTGQGEKPDKDVEKQVGARSDLANFNC